MDREYYHYDENGTLITADTLKVTGDTVEGSKDQEIKLSDLNPNSYKSTDGRSTYV